MTLSDLTPVPPGHRVELTDAGAAEAADAKDALKAELDRLRTRLGELQEVFYADGRRALLVVLQGRDTSGKDGTIGHVLGGMNPLGVRVTSFRKPTTEELAHDYLWRVHRAVPERGMIGIFNRSHYEDVLVVRVHELVPEAVWSRRYDQINAFERHLTECGTVIVKFMLHISRAEQAQRLRDRLDDPTKNWKFNAGDLAERARWDEYTRAYEDALSRCSTAEAPWYIVPADRKRVRDVLVARTLVRVMEGLGAQYPQAAAEVLALKEKIE
jgi:PPK2 family polyphosphate:nucleotide phosphotransferase